MEQLDTPMVNEVEGEVVPAAAAKMEDEYVGKLTVAAEPVTVVPFTVRTQVEAVTVPEKVTVAVCANPLILTISKPSAAMPLLKFKNFMVFPLKK